MKAKFNNCFIIHSKNFPVFKGVSTFYSLFFCSPTITQPRPQVFSVNGSITCSVLHFWCHFDIIGSIWQNFWCHWLNMTNLNFWCHRGNMTGQSSFLILSAAAGYGESRVVLTNQKWEIFWMNNKYNYGICWLGGLFGEKLWLRAEGHIFTPEVTVFHHTDRP